MRESQRAKARANLLLELTTNLLLVTDLLLEYSFIVTGESQRASALKIAYT